MKWAPSTIEHGPGRLDEGLVALAKASQEIAAELSLERLLQLIVNHARAILKCRYAALGIFSQKGRLQQFATSGIDESTRQGMGALPQGKGLLGAVLGAKGPIRVDDISRHPASVGFPPGHPQMRSFLGVPIRYQDKPLGNLYLTEKLGGGAFTEADAEVVAMFAAQAAVAIHNAHLFLREQEARAEAEAAQRALAESQESLRTSEKQLQDILDNTTAVIYIKDMEGRYISVNRRYETLFHIKSEEIRGKTDYDIFPPEIAEVLRNNDQSVLESGIPTESEEVVPQDDGPHTYISVKFLLKNQAGTPYAVCAISTDITSLKKVDELRDNIISLVSHELRTPLFHIKGFASTLLQTDVAWDEETRIDFIRTIEQEADRLTRLVSDLLDMSRLESGRTVMALEPVVLPLIARSATEHIAPFLNGRVVKRRFPRGLPLALADSGQIERVLENLLENASKYSAEGKSITVSARSANGDLLVAVRDYGVGIPEHERERIFEKFVRLEHGGEFRSPGTGLGLSICKAIIEAHGGRIWVEGFRGGGSVFYFTLPQAESSLPKSSHTMVRS